MRILILGEAVVDLVCEQPVAGAAQVRALAPRVGGAGARVACTAAGHGARVTLAAPVGDGPWGTWLRARLAEAGVAVTAEAGAEDAPPALTTRDAAGVVTRHAPALGTPAARAGALAVVAGLEAAVAACELLCLTSAALVAPAGQEASLASRALAAAGDRPVVLLAALEPWRWANPGRAATLARELVPGAFLLLDAAGARSLSGEADPVRAAEGLLAAGARTVALDGGAAGAWVRGEGARRHVPGTAFADEAAAHLRWAGVLLARLADAGGYPSALAAALDDAAAARGR